MYVPNLKSCPKCGGEAKIIGGFKKVDIYFRKPPVYKYAAECQECGNTGEWSRHERGAAVAWNTEGR